MWIKDGKYRHLRYENAIFPSIDICCHKCCEACYGSHPFVRMTECNHSLEWLNYIRGTQIKTKDISYSRIAIWLGILCPAPSRAPPGAILVRLVIQVSAAGTSACDNISSAMILIYAKCGEIKVMIQYNIGSGMDYCVLITALHDRSTEISHRRSIIVRPVGWVPADKFDRI